MLRREELLEQISHRLATLRSYIELKGLIHLYDSHIIAEDFMANLLNIIFGYRLENLNYIHKNQPGIDLGDTDNSIAFQVTAERSRRKIQETIDIFVKEQLYEKYHQLYFLILTRKQQRYSPFNTAAHFSFDGGKHILDIGDLIEEANTLPTERLGQIAGFLETETRSIETVSPKRTGVPIDSWANYLYNLSEHHRQWHIPSELRPLIAWNVPPVAIDDYIRLKPAFERSFLPEIRKPIQSGSLPSLRLSEVIAKAPVLIMGSAGAGKSTCLRSLCNRLAAEARAKLERENSWDGTKAPVLVTLRRYGPVRLQELIRSHLRYHHLSVTHEHLESLLEDNHFIFLLDGLDEVQPKWRDDLVNEIVALHETYPDHSIIVTTRKQPQPPFLKGFEVYEIRPLEQQAISAFAKAYLGPSYRQFLHQVEERGIDDLLRVPLLLTLCLIVFKSERTAFDSLAGVYTKIVELYKVNWEDPGRSQRVDIPLDWFILEETLAKLAYWMVADGNAFSFSREALLEFLKDIVADFERASLVTQAHCL